MLTVVANAAPTVDAAINRAPDHSKSLTLVGYLLQKYTRSGESPWIRPCSRNESLLRFTNGIKKTHKTNWTDIGNLLAALKRSMPEIVFAKNPKGRRESLQSQFSDFRKSYRFSP
jgi:hypothetical protein